MTYRLKSKDGGKNKNPKLEILAKEIAQKKKKILMKFISSTNDIRKYLGLKPKKDIKFKNISIDTRTIKKDSLFIALRRKFQWK